MDTPPLSAEAVDELLSADLDGEFDAAARDLGLDPADARTQLARVAGIETRRAALTRAQRALAVLPEIDELMAARLRSKAVRAGEQAAQEEHKRHRARRWQRALAVSGAVAAAAAVVVGVVATTKGSNTNNKSATASGAAADATAPSTALAGSGESGGAAGTPIDVGEVPDVQTLAARVTTADAALTPKKKVDTPGPSQPESVSTNKTARATSPAGSDKTLAPVSTNQDFAYAPRQAPTVEVCDATARTFAGVTTGAILRAVATINGTQVTAEVFRKESTHVLVVLTLDCRLLNLRTITPAG